MLEASVLLLAHVNKNIGCAGEKRGGRGDRANSSDDDDGGGGGGGVGDKDSCA
jgi:hypothetical protein